MSDLISDTELYNNIHPITKKLLNHEISLNEISLQGFREGRIVYDSQYKAQAKGFEAHHITPRSLQGDVITDDRCMRYTPFEHIIDHYLMAKEDSKYTYIFYCMLNFQENSLKEEEINILDKCIEVGKLREQGRQQVSLSLKDKYTKEKNSMYGKHHSEESKKKIGDAHRGMKHTAESKEKNRIAHLGKAPGNKGKPMPDNVKETLMKINKGNHYHQGHKHSDETKLRISKSKKGQVPWNKGKEGYKVKARSEESKKKLSEVYKLVVDEWNIFKKTDKFKDNPITWNEFQKIVNKRKSK